jgi:peptide deformylase
MPKPQASFSDLTKTLLNKTDPPGVGLSAIQVGAARRIFLTYLPREPKLPSKSWTPENLEINIFINPKSSTATSKKMTLGGKRGRPFLEGCLSIPRLYGPVNRHQWIDVTYETIQAPGLPGNTDAIKPSLKLATR